MTDLDTLRQALHAPLRGSPRGLDMGQVIAKGRRARRRRRARAAGGWSACLAAALAAVVAVTTMAGRVGGAHRPGLTALPATASLGVPGTRAMVRTGVRSSAGELVFYTVPVHGVPGTRFGIVSAYRDSSGRLSKLVETNEFRGSATSPGFHAVEGAMTVNRDRVPEFGYYAGPVATITGVVTGKTIRASLGLLSTNPEISVFWFRSGRDATGLVAYNAAGHRLPAGHTTIGEG